MSDKTASKQSLLVNSICENIEKVMDPKFAGLQTQISTELAQMNVLLASIVGRLEVIENHKLSKSGSSKRAPRGESKTGSNGKKASSSGANPDKYSKVKNAMLFCRIMWAESDDFRAKYQTDDYMTIINGVSTVTKKPEGSFERHLAEGTAIWRKCLTNKEKTAVRDEFGLWKVARVKAALEPNLIQDKATTT